jgi:hypothetical protein
VTKAHAGVRILNTRVFRCRCINERGRLAVIWSVLLIL